MHENAAVVRRAYQAFNDGDLETLTALFDESASWHSPGRNPIAGDHGGRNAVFTQFGHCAGANGRPRLTAGVRDSPGQEGGTSPGQEGGTRASAEHNGWHRDKRVAPVHQGFLCGDPALVSLRSRSSCLASSKVPSAEHDSWTSAPLCVTLGAFVAAVDRQHGSDGPSVSKRSAWSPLTLVRRRRVRAAANGR